MLYLGLFAIINGPLIHLHGDKPVLAVRLLGQFDSRRDGTPRTIPLCAPQSLLAYRLLAAGTTHPREKLAGKASGYLRQALETESSPRHGLA